MPIKSTYNFQKKENRPGEKKEQEEQTNKEGEREKKVEVLKENRNQSIEFKEKM